MFDLSEHNVLITSGTGGIGWAAAKLFVHLGARAPGRRFCFRKNVIRYDKVDVAKLEQGLDAKEGVGSHREVPSAL